MNNNELINALNQIEKEKGIDKEIIFEAIETSLVSACKKNFGTSQNIKVVMDRDLGIVKVFAQKEVVEVVEDELLQISLDDARKSNALFQIGDFIDIVVTPRNFGRIAAQTAKQVVVQKFREAEREIVYNKFITKEKEIVFGKIQRKERKNTIIIGLGDAEAVLTQEEQIPNEEYNLNDKIRVYVVDVKQSAKGPVINVSRTHPELVKRLFELEVPEVHDGIVTIKSIAREAGSRTKIAVYSKDPDVDPVGACVGANGQRVQIIVDELRNEKIDIVKYSDSAKEFIKAALSPCKVVDVKTNELSQSAKVIVPDSQLSLAIGKEGQNARLAAKLTGWKIDIKSESQASKLNFNDLDMAIESEVNKKEVIPEPKEPENYFGAVEDFEADDLFSDGAIDSQTDTEEDFESDDDFATDDDFGLETEDF